jgi:hypothetical protein
VHSNTEKSELLTVFIARQINNTNNVNVRAVGFIVSPAKDPLEEMAAFVLIEEGDDFEDLEWDLQTCEWATLLSSVTVRSGRFVSRLTVGV